MSRRVPPCNQIGCDYDEPHTHSVTELNVAVVVEPKRPGAPGWAYTQPHGVTVGDAVDHMIPVLLDGQEDPVPVATDLLTKYHTWRRRKPPKAKPKLMPRLPKSHRITEKSVEEPPLFGGAA